MSAFQKHYQEKFRGNVDPAAAENFEEYLSGLIVKQISSEEKLNIAEPISLEEIEKTLINMKNGTSPGSDDFQE